MLQAIPCLSKFQQVWLVLVLADVFILGFGRAIQDDGRFLCFPSPKTEKYCICFDMEDSTYAYVPTNEFPAQLALMIQDGHFEHMIPADDHVMNEGMKFDQHKRETGGDVQAVKSLLLSLIRQVSSYQGVTKRSHVLSKRPFDSISYGSYFGGFGKR